MIVVTGGTGTVGTALIERLCGEGSGREVRAVVRRPVELGVDTVIGDFEEPESIGAALSPGDRLFLNANPFPRFAETFEAVVDLAGAAGVAQIVTVSVLGAVPGGRLAGGVHGEVDEHLRASGIPYAILQPTGFMQYFRTELRQDRFYGSYGAQPVNYIDARDIGDVAAALLTAPVGESRDYLLTGPESPTHDEIAAVMTTVLGREIRYVDLPVADLAARLAGAGVRSPMPPTCLQCRPRWGRSGRRSTRRCGRSPGGRLVPWPGSWPTISRRSLPESCGRPGSGRRVTGVGSPQVSLAPRIGLSAPPSAPMQTARSWSRVQERCSSQSTVSTRTKVSQLMITDDAASRRVPVRPVISTMR